MCICVWGYTLEKKFVFFFFLQDCSMKEKANEELRVKFKGFPDGLAVKDLAFSLLWIGLDP